MNLVSSLEKGVKSTQAKFGLFGFVVFYFVLLFVDMGVRLVHITYSEDTFSSCVT